MILILQQLAFTTFILLIFSSLLQLSCKNKLPLNYFLSGLFFTSGYIIFYYWAFGLGLLKYFPLFINTDVAVTYLVGLFLFLYYRELTGKKNIRAQFLLFFFLPFFATLIVILIINLADPLIYFDYINNNQLVPDYTKNRTIFIINFFGDLSLVVYFIISLYRLTIFLRIRKITYEFKIIFICTLLLLANALMLVAGNILHNTSLMLFSIGFFPIIPIFYTFFSFRYPDFTLQVIKEAKNIRYKRSIERKYDSVLIESRLIQLMEEEKLYTDYELTLKSLSDMLMISPHELSHLLNNRFNKNFNTFVNSYRIAEAKALLLRYPGMGILEIAFSAGFNSKTSFYNYFLREIGESPKDFRGKNSR